MPLRKNGVDIMVEKNAVLMDMEIVEDDHKDEFLRKIKKLMKDGWIPIFESYNHTKSSGIGKKDYNQYYTSTVESYSMFMAKDDSPDSICFNK